MAHSQVIDRAVLLTMPDSPRKAWMQAQLQAAGLAARTTVWHGLNGRWAGLAHAHYPHLKGGMVDCWNSWWNIFQFLFLTSENDDEVLLLVEDDALLPPDIEAQLGQLIARLPDDWGFCFAGYMQRTPSTPAVTNVANGVGRVNQLYGTHCMLARPWAVRLAWELLRAAGIQNQVDIQLCAEVLPAVNAYAPATPLVRQSGEFPSGIQPAPSGQPRGTKDNPRFSAGNIQGVPAKALTVTVPIAK